MQDARPIGSGAPDEGTGEEVDDVQVGAPATGPSVDGPPIEPTSDDED